MSIPLPTARFRKNVRGFYAWVGAVLFAGVAPPLAATLVHSGTLTGRIAGVVIGTLSWIPMIAIVIALIRAGDEYQRRLHLIALALSFATALVLLTLLDWLVTAHFLSPPPFRAIWVVFALLWVSWLAIVKRHFERAG